MEKELLLCVFLIGFLCGGLISIFTGDTKQRRD